MELKYCERCGGLLLRRSGDPVVYCGPCGRKMDELPETRSPGKSQPGRNTRRCVERTAEEESLSGPRKLGPEKQFIDSQEQHGRLA